MLMRRPVLLFTTAIGVLFVVRMRIPVSVSSAVVAPGFGFALSSDFSTQLQIF
jgi:hypothetical protein